ncbi:MAG TPA: F0F1 ATP synthase subunit delta [Patescibacteria group bacterium]|jgi:F-type H+-transporting ATPase subunit delta
MQKVIITTATPINAKSLASFKKALAQKLDQTIELELRVDPLVIGGSKVRIGSKVIDLTIAAKLAQIKKQLLKQL